MFPIRKPLLFGAAIVASVSLAGCVSLLQKMTDQPKFKPLRASEFYADGRSSRPLVEGTVARGHLRTDDHTFTGKVNGQLVDKLPFPLTKAVLERGRGRFNIYCAPCHDQAGTGEGMVVKRGYKQPPSMHVDRLRQAPLGHFYDVMTNGFGAMPDYTAQVNVRDRWAIAAYIRTLQFSQHAAAAALPQGDRAAVENPPAQAAPAAPAAHH